MKPLFFLFLLVLGCQQPQKNSISGKVVKVADGDTFTLLDAGNQQVRVRLHGIDAPERGQDFGNVARQKLADLLAGKSVRIEEMDVDRYGRTVAIVYTADGVCVNEQLLKEGLAWHYKEYDANEAWAKLEANAKKEKRGLWSQRNAVAPWQWRKDKRKEPTKKAA